MYYATEDAITTADKSNDPAWIEITEQQYHEALAGMQAGKVVTIDGGFAVIDKPEPEPEPQPEPEPEPRVSEQVTRAQGKAVLVQAGHWAAVLDYVANIEDPTEKALADIALNDTTHWRRDSPFLNTAAKALGLTSGQLDDLFIQAAEIQL